MSARSLPLTLFATAAIGLALSGCKVDNRPLLARNGPPPMADAGPPLEPLGPADAYAPGALTPAQVYAYPARAYAVSRAYQQARPNYGFRYGEEQPWAWEGDDSLMFAEPISDGYRYYYYQPGQDSPYFVQAPDYGYAYGDGGALLAVFSAAGALLGADQYAPVYDEGRGYWRRGYDLENAYRSAPRYAVSDEAWRSYAPAVTERRARWFEPLESRPEWREAVAAAPGYGEAHHGPPPWAGPKPWSGPKRDRQDFAAAPRALPPGQAKKLARNEGFAADRAPGPGWQEHGRRGKDGPPAYARAAEEHGQNVAFQSPAPKEHGHGGGPKWRDGDHGGGGGGRHDNGHGGGHGDGKGRH